VTKTAKLLSILLPIAILLSFSLTILGSINQIYLEQQAISIIVAGIIFVFFSILDYRVFALIPWSLYAIANISLVATFLFGSFSRGSIRWIDLGFIRFQQSEFAKPLLIIFFAVLMSKAINTPKKYIQLLLIMMPPLALIFLQPDLGSTLIVGAVLGSQLLASSIPKKYLVMTVVTALIVSPLLWSVLRPYQKERVMSFIAPASDPLGSGYNAIQAVISVGSGKVMGRGLGQGTQSQLKFLPERQTDFIFASISEEFGFLGSATIIAAYCWLLASIIRFAITANDEVGRLTSVGTFFVILLQAFVNIGMNIGLLPITGITLPLVSLGGSSLISIAVLLGVMTNIQQSHEIHRPSLEIK
jgi:rod shape determining protein RodA